MSAEELARLVAERDADYGMGDPRSVRGIAEERLSGLSISPGYWAFYAIRATMDLDQAGPLWELRGVYESLSADQRLAVDLVFLALCGITLRAFLAAERLEDVGAP